jgi:hypothetical protein
VKEGKKTLEEGIDAYNKEMIERAGEEVRGSKLNTEMLHDWERMKNAPLLQRGGDPNVKKVTSDPSKEAPQVAT